MPKVTKAKPKKAQPANKAPAKKKVSPKTAEQSPLEKLNSILDSRDKVAQAHAEKLQIPSTHAFLYEYLRKSGTGKAKLQFLLKLEFVDEKGKAIPATQKKKIAEIAMVAFSEEFPESLTTALKIKKFAESL